MRRISTFIVILGVVLAACSGGDAGDTSTTAAPDSSSTAPADTTTTGAEATSSTVEAVTTTGAAGAGGGGSDCIVGTWIMDNEVFIANMSGVFEGADMGGAEVTALGGTYTVQMDADGSLLAIRDGWGFQVGTSEGTVIIEMNGEDTGTWSADDTTMTVEIDISDVLVNSRIEVDGQEVPLPTAPVDVPEGIASGSTYECTADTLTITNSGITSVLNRA